MLKVMDDEEIAVRNEQLKQQIKPGTIITSQYYKDGKSVTYCRLILRITENVYYYVQLNDTKTIINRSSSTFNDLGCINIVSQP
jgi:hypothetical protein